MFPPRNSSKVKKKDSNCSTRQLLSLGDIIWLNYFIILHRRKGRPFTVPEKQLQISHRDFSHHIWEKTLLRISRAFIYCVALRTNCAVIMAKSGMLFYTPSNWGTGTWSDTPQSLTGRRLQARCPESLPNDLSLKP